MNCYDGRMRRQFVFPAILLALGLLFMGALRLASYQPGFLTPFAGLATPGYVLWTVAMTIWMVRAGLPLDRFGFQVGSAWRLFLLTITAVAILRLVDVFLDPLIEDFFGGPRNLERFADVRGSVTALMALLVLNWTFAAFGEEFAYRILLMKCLAYAMGNTRLALVFALLLQALVFGFVHAYQGSAGIAGATISGLIFGIVTLAGRWSIWPAALAHGINNTFGILSLYYG